MLMCKIGLRNASSQQTSNEKAGYSGSVVPGMLSEDSRLDRIDGEPIPRLSEKSFHKSVIYSVRCEWQGQGSLDSMPGPVTIWRRSENSQTGTKEVPKKFYD
jgi:hypothetical protein